VKIYLLKRILALIPVLFVVSVVIFLIIHITPGDPASVMLGESATEQDVKALRQQLGLDLPLYQQYVNWIADVLRGDLGDSYFMKESVAESRADRRSRHCHPDWHNGRFASGDGYRSNRYGLFFAGDGSSELSASPLFDSLGRGEAAMAACGWIQTTGCGAVEPSEILDSPCHFAGGDPVCIDYVERRDYAVIQGVVLFVTAAYVFINLIVDMLYGVIDPRVRLERK
jgi:hypothetical protein